MPTTFYVQVTLILRLTAILHTVALALILPKIFQSLDSQQVLEPHDKTVLTMDGNHLEQ